MKLDPIHQALRVHVRSEVEIEREGEDFTIFVKAYGKHDLGRLLKVFGIPEATRARVMKEAYSDEWAESYVEQAARNGDTIRVGDNVIVIIKKE